MAKSGNTVATPTGTLRIYANVEGVTHILWPQQDMPEGADLQMKAGAAYIDTAITEITEYFAGEREYFSVQTAPSGTDFQIAVWTELKKIPFGSTVSYGWIASQLGNPAAVRAVGGAIGSNPLSIVIPCHRVIGSDGKLTGFAGGIEIKKILLIHEGAWDPA